VNVVDDMVMALALMGSSQHVVRDTHGNVSRRDGNVVWIKPSGVPYAEINVWDIPLINVSSGESLVSDRLKPSVDLPHHLAVYRRYDWVGGICHTHSPYATAFAAAKLPIPCVTTEHADYFGEEIPCLPYMPLDGWGAGVDLLHRQKAVLLGHHGVLTFGNDATHAVRLAVAVENVAQKTFLAWQLRGLHLDLPKKEVERWYVRYNGGGYGQ
jgi:L-ribulose-5-phosphate 4-epimerase